MKEVIIHGITFHKLKSVPFIYVNKTYSQERLISEDKKIYMTQDSVDYVKVYTGKRKENCHVARFVS